MTRNRFLCIGECMVELAQLDGDTYRRGFAGDTFNTAWYARRLLPPDWQVGYASCIGTDAVSHEMAQFMRDQGIDTTSLRAVPDRTVGLYMISIDKGERSFSYWRSQSAAKCLAEDTAWLTETLQERDVIYFSGITLAILSPAHRANLRDAIAAARAGGALVAFDTNLRPRLWEDTATMKAEMTLGAAVADVVLPSFDEETQLFGDATPKDTIARYRDGGANVVAVKNGGEALTLWDRAAGTLDLPVHNVAQVVDTTAAGDSFGAAFVAGIATGTPREEAAEQAMALAAKVIQAKGALVPGIFEGGSASS
ncbi:sugar kinase [Arenibacterium sp. CAU 1754]